MRLNTQFRRRRKRLTSAVGDFQTIVYQPGPVARVILNRPERRNAQSWQLLGEMDAAFEAAAADPECRVIVLSGRGPSFSAGHDIDSPDQLADRAAYEQEAGPFARTERRGEIYLDSHIRWRNLPKPMIAMVHGYCVFGGWMIAAAMDVVFAADNALLIPVYGDYCTTTWDVGARKAKELLFGNRFLTATEAMQCGFVNRVFPAADLESETLKYASRVAENSEFLNRTVKFGINQTLDMMGFTTSVRALRPNFFADRTLPPAGERRGDSVPAGPDRGRFRSQVQRAVQYAREDGILTLER